MQEQCVSDIGDYKKGLQINTLIVKDDGKLRLCILNPILKGSIELY